MPESCYTTISMTVCVFISQAASLYVSLCCLRRRKPLSFVSHLKPRELPASCWALIGGTKCGSSFHEGVSWSSVTFAVTHFPELEVKPIVCVFSAVIMGNGAKVHLWPLISLSSGLSVCLHVYISCQIQMFSD